MFIQSGTVIGHSDLADWELDEENTLKKFSRKITFNPPFDTPPNVFVAISHISADEQIGVRVEVTAAKVTRSGCTISIKKWDRTRLNSVHAAWIAYGSKS